MFFQCKVSPLLKFRYALFIIVGFSICARYIRLHVFVVVDIFLLLPLLHFLRRAERTVIHIQVYLSIHIYILLSLSLYHPFVLVYTCAEYTALMRATTFKGKIY